MGMTCTLYALSKEDASSLAAGDRGRQPHMLDTCELDKSWGAIHYFVSGSGDTSPADPQIKDFLMSGIVLEDIAEHAAIHAPTEVAEFARELSHSTTEQLMNRFDPDRMNQLKVYGGPWDEHGRPYILQFVEPFRQFVLTAAEAGHAMLILIY